MKRHPGSGRRAGVDFCIILTDEHGRIIGRIPGEVKGLIELKHVNILETAVSTEGLLLLSIMFLYQYSCHSSTYRSLHCSP